MSDPALHSCMSCQTEFLVDNKVQKPVLSPWQTWSSSGKPVTMADLMSLSTAGCDFAKFIAQTLVLKNGDIPLDAVIVRYPPDGYEEYPNSFIIGLPNTSYVHFTYMVHGDSPVANDVSQRLPNLNPGSKESFDRARTWIRECLENHQCCPKPQSTFMPTRVLEVSEPGLRVRIREKLPPAPYAVLSYCWGGPQLVCLTKSRRAVTEWTIEWKTLPKTVQDAASAVCRLGLKHLWVDSLCIIQDDAEDMALEIGRMADVYQHSYVAIMASRAKSVDEGFLHARFPFGITNANKGFQLPYRSKDGQRGSVIVIEEEASIAYTNPLRKRGWAFQEFMLSPRILDYGQMGTTWICYDSQNPTDGFSSLPTSIWSRLRFHEFLSSTTKNSITSKAMRDSETPDAFFHSVWTGFVQEYGKGQLTFAHDKLPAIAGVAERMNVQFGGDYLAGCWRNELWYGLVWHNRNGQHQKRHPDYFAPSWSWASIPDGNIGFISTNHCTRDEGFCIVDCQTELVNTSAKYGAVKSGSLTVCGRTILARYEKKPNSGALFKDFVSVKLPENYEEMPGTAILPDAMLDEAIEGTSLWLLCVCWDSKRIKMWGVILRQLSSGTYFRIGLFSISLRQVNKASAEGVEQLWQETLANQTFTIV